MLEEPFEEVFVGAYLREQIAHQALNLAALVDASAVAFVIWLCSCEHALARCACDYVCASS
jgi:hypothetical protein